MSDSVWPHRRQPTRLPRPWDSPGKNTGVGCHFLLQCMKVKSESEVAQSCPTLSDPMDCSPPGSSIHGIFQARVLEWKHALGSHKLNFRVYFLFQIAGLIYFQTSPPDLLPAQQRSNFPGVVGGHTPERSTASWPWLQTACMTLVGLLPLTLYSSPCLQSGANARIYQIGVAWLLN